MLTRDAVELTVWEIHTDDRDRLTLFDELGERVRNVSAGAGAVELEITLPGTT